MAIIKSADPDLGQLGVRAFTSDLDDPQEWFCYCVRCSWSEKHPAEAFTPDQMEALLRKHYADAGHGA